MFVGRERELAELERLYARGGFQMVVLYGRRRVGKTALAARFAQGKPTLSYTAKVQSDALNLADFSARCYEFFGLPPKTGSFASWDDALRFVAKGATDRHMVFVFDEFPYAAQRNPSLLSTLQVAIDRLFSDTNVFMILSGSNQGFMEGKVLGASGPQDGIGEKNPLFGRRTAQIHLAPFGYRDAARMLEGVAPTDLVGYYAVFGGTPYYLAMVDADEPLAANIERLFFHKEGLLYEEPLMLLRQELREPAVYSSILGAIASGANRPQAIADKLGEERTSISKYLRTLESIGLVRRRVPFGEDRERSRKGIYEVAEPAFDFWYRFVRPSIDTIEMDAGELAARDLLAGGALPTYVGRWFESVCLQWLVERAKTGSLPISPTRFGTWWGTNPAAREQADVDVVADNKRRGELLAGECKWRGSFDESETADKLVRRAGLLGDYPTVRYALFTKNPVSPTTRKKLGDAWLFVTAEDLYADGA